MLSLLDRVLTSTATERRPHITAPIPICSHTRWWLRLPSSSVGGECAWLSRALVNLGIVGFAAAVAWFYFSDIMTAMSRSLGLIGLGILFLAGGWALEKMRRRILAAHDSRQIAAAIRRCRSDGGAL